MMRHGLLMMMTVVALVFGGIQSAGALPIAEIEPNDTIATAQNIDGSFSLDASPNIGDSVGTDTSTVIPHVTIDGTGDGSFDYYSFAVSSAGTVGIFDIDFGIGAGGVDTQLFLYTPGGVLLAGNDDLNPFATVGAGGSVSGLDAFIQHTFIAAGTYVIGVCEFLCSGLAGGITGNLLDPGDTYTLQVSIEGHPTQGGGPTNGVIPEPGTMLLLGSGLIGLAAWRRYTNKL